jgi:hypothetical protein
MHNSVSDGIDFVHVLNDTEIRIGESLDNFLKGDLVVGKVVCFSSFLPSNLFWVIIELSMPTLSQSPTARADSFVISIN